MDESSLLAIRSHILEGRVKDAYLASRKYPHKKLWTLFQKIAVEEIGMVNPGALETIESFRHTPMNSELGIAQTIVFLCLSEKSSEIHSRTLSLLKECDVSKKASFPAVLRYKALVEDAVNIFKSGNLEEFLKSATILYMVQAHPKDAPCPFDIKIEGEDMRELAWGILKLYASQETVSRLVTFYHFWRETKKHYPIFLLACLYALSHPSKDPPILECTDEANMLLTLGELAPDDLVSPCPATNDISKTPLSVRKLRQALKRSCVIHSNSILSKRKREDTDSSTESSHDSDLGCAKESELFRIPLRVNTRETKCVSYLALSVVRDAGSPSYYIKGPFSRKSPQLQAQLDLDHLKRALDSQRLISIVERKIQVIPDLFQPIRSSRPFLVMKDIWGYDPLTTAIRKQPDSETLLLDPSKGRVRTLEWSALDRLCQTNPESALFFLCALAFRYIFEVQDTDRTNFVVDYSTGKIYSLEETSFMQGPRLFFTKRPLPTEVRVSIMALLRKHWVDMLLILANWKQKLQTSHEIKVLFESQMDSDARDLKRALEHLTELEEEGHWMQRISKPL